MQFRVPQFIDIEDKIFGPLTLKQFLYCVGAGGTGFVIIKLVPIFLLGVVLAVPVSGFFLALAFLKINNRPFIDFSESVFNYMLKAKVYIWRQPVPKIEDKELAPLVLETTKETVIEKASEDKLHDIAFNLDVKNTNSQEDEE